MRHWLGLLRLEFMTGEDGRLAFWKMVTVAAGVFCAALAVGAYRQGGLVAALPWLVSLAVVLLFASHSLKGLSVWAKSKAVPTVTGATATTINAAEVVKAIKAEPDYRTDDER